MNEHSRQEELREAWIESLLVSATRPQSHSDRIDRALSEIDIEPVAAQSLGHSRNRIRSVRWGVTGVVAALLLVSFFVIQTDGNSHSAMAAVQRSFEVAAQQTTRRYLLQIEHRSENGGTRTTDVDLYVGGSDRFALRHPSPLPGTSVWLGRNGAQSWIVSPLGLVLKGDHTLHRRWAREELDTPNLHISALLTRMMSRGYRLEALSDEEITIPDGPSVECQHIRAQCTTPDQPELPATLELWASRESGMAVRLMARWAIGEAESAKESIVLSFQGEEPSLSDDWFTAEAHVSNERSHDSPRDDVDL